MATKNNEKETLAHGSAHLEQMLCFALYATSRATMDIYRPLLDELGLTYPQYLVMIILWEHKTCSVKDIGNLLHLDSGTLSPLLKRLEAAGVIKRERSRADERVVNISLTDVGRELEARAAHIPEQFGCKLDLQFDEYVELITRLKQLLAKINVAS